MNAVRKLKAYILNKYNPSLVVAANDWFTELDDMYEKFLEDPDSYELLSEIRYGEYQTDLEPLYDRNYECKIVATKMPNDTYVAWPYWYGGGKHGNPEELEWVDYAFDVKCNKVVKTVLEWEKIDV